MPVTKEYLLANLSILLSKTSDRHFSLIPFQAWRELYEAQKAAMAQVCEERDALRVALEGLRNAECFCPVGIGNPMYSAHSEACRRATAVSPLLVPEEVQPADLDS